MRLRDGKTDGRIIDFEFNARATESVHPYPIPKFKARMKNEELPARCAQSRRLAKAAGSAEPQFATSRGAATPVGKPSRDARGVRRAPRRDFRGVCVPKGHSNAVILMGRSRTEARLQRALFCTLA